MKPVEPTVHENATLVIFAKDQPPYIPLPASVDANGLVMTEWELSEEEANLLFMGGRIRLWIHGTEVQNGRPLTPVSLHVIEPPCGFQSKES